METKFILHGGYAKGVKQEDDLFFSEVLSTAPREAKILLVYFAEDNERVAERTKDDIEQFEKNKGDRSLSFETATEELFPEQANTADVIYLHGGHSKKLLDALEQFPGLKKAFAGKIVAGDSAGANVLAAAFYSKSIGVQEGLGIIPIKIISHYLEENKNKLADIKPDLETLFLPEFELKTFIINI
jgi:peptidase E